MYSILVSNNETIKYLLLECNLNLSIKDSINMFTVSDFISESKDDYLIELFKNRQDYIFLSLNKRITFKIDEKFDETIFKKLNVNYQNIFKNYQNVFYFI
jgi:hypothetical protein